MSNEAEQGYARGSKDARDWLAFHKPGPYAVAEDLHAAKEAQKKCGADKDAYGYCYWDGYIVEMENANKAKPVA